jgi:hypothetical protein
VSAKATTLGQPTGGSLYHSGPGGELGFAKDRTVLNEWFVAPPPMVDMRHVALLFNLARFPEKVVIAEPILA